jgi:hypothetical protein
VCSGSATINGLTVGKGNGTGNYNTAFGDSSLAANTSGTANTANGYNSLVANTTGGQNTANGYQSLVANTTGSNNTAFGTDSLAANTIGTYNTAFGYNADVDSGSYTNCTSIGNGAMCTASNQIQLGNSSVGVLKCQVALTVVSDRRDKKDIENLESSLAFVEQLKPVRFNWNMRDGGKVDIPEIGFIAQDLQQVQKDTGITIPNLVYESNPEQLGVTYSTLLPLLVKSIQELSQKNQELSQEIQDLKKEITYLHERIS